MLENSPKLAVIIEKSIDRLIVPYNPSVEMRLTWLMFVVEKGTWKDGEANGHRKRWVIGNCLEADREISIYYTVTNATMAARQDWSYEQARG
jgi:hypothetical protein